MFPKIYSWIIDRPWQMLAVLVLITGALAYFATGIEFSSDLEKMLPPDDRAVMDYVEAAREFGSQAYILLAIQEEETLFNPRALRKIGLISEECEGLKELGIEEIQTPLNAGVLGSLVSGIPQQPEEIESYRRLIMGEPLLRKVFVSQDETTGLIILKEELDVADTAAEIRLIDGLEKIARKYEGPQAIHLSGRPYMTASIQRSMVRDLRTLVPVALVVLALILLLSFRSPRGVLLPITVVLVSTTWTVGIMALAGAKLTIVSIAMPVVLIAIGDADAIHILTRYNRVAGEKPRREAILATMDAMTRPIILTSLTSAGGFLGLLSSYSAVVKDFGLFTAVGIVMAMVFSLSFLPATLSLLARTRKAAGAHPPWRTGRAPRWAAGLTANHPLAVALVGAAVASAFALGIPRLTIDTSPLEAFREGHPVLRNTRFSEEEFGGSLTLRVVIDAAEPDGLLNPALLGKMVELQEVMESLPGVGFAISLADIVKGINRSLRGDLPEVYRIPEAEAQVAEALSLYQRFTGGGLREWVSSDYRRGQITALLEARSSLELRRTMGAIDSYLSRELPGLEAKLVGAPVYIVRLGETLVTSQVRSLVVSLLAVWIMLILSLRSIVMGTIGIIPLSFASIILFGLMGFGNIKLTISTAMVASISIGLGVDFAIHFIEEFRRRRAAGGGFLDVISGVFSGVGWGITLNAASLGLGFSVLLLSDFLTTMHFGLMVGLTAVSMFLATMLLLPAVLKLAMSRGGTARKGSS